MVELGFTLSAEEREPSDLVRLAGDAERAGFSFATISDHFHPWTSTQGNSPFVWSVLGGIASTTERIRVGTAVTCPLIRIHPAIVAQAAATVAAMMPGRFFLGLGTGENLNEHVTGARWPSASERRDMLEEAIAVIRELWKGEIVDHRGRWYHIVDAQLFTTPDKSPPIYVAAGGPLAAGLAARLSDGLIATSPDRQLLESFDREGGRDKPRFAQVTVCWAADERTAVETAMRWWPTAALKGELSQELSLPRHFEQAASTVTEEQLTEAIVCGPDAERHVEAIRKYVDAGYDHVFVHQVGPDQSGGLAFYAEQVLPRFAEAAQVRKAG
jgi:coenzyme F420-dependent glucose-6-phosphate dehydrogenase